MAMQLGSMTWTDQDDPVVVVPVGSCEQHGPHLPLATDTVIATALADELARRRSGFVVAPPITVAASGEHAGFPGTLSIGSDVLAQVIVEIVRSADWARGVVFVNGHGGNADALRDATATIHAEGRRALSWSPRVDGGDPHAGVTETSIMLAIAPDQVRLDALARGPVPTMAELRSRGVLALSPNGVLGDPTDADAARGRAIVERLVDDLATAVDRWAT